MQIDVDTELANKPLSVREKIAVFVLLMIFAFIAPAKYSHQVKELVEEVDGLLKK